ncbi:MAG: hypothetical protein ABFD50_22290 [Smithella sp.]
MRFFLDSETGEGLHGDGKLKFGVTNCYIEIEICINNSYLVLYYIPKGDHSFFVATCWERLFDDILENIDDNDYRDTIIHTWPTLAKLLFNGANDKYREGALIKLEDYDDGEPKWFVASVVGNIDIEDISDFVTGKSGEIAKLVIEKSLALYTELNNEKPSTMRSVIKGLTTGIAIGICAYFGIDPSDFQ